jgi:hypothetical protein
METTIDCFPTGASVLFKSGEASSGDRLDMPGVRTTATAQNARFESIVDAGHHGGEFLWIVRIED